MKQNILPTQDELARVKQLADMWHEAARQGMPVPEGCGSPQAFAVRILMGLELGLPPATAIYGMSVSDNNVSLDAQTRVALTRRRKVADIDLIEVSDQRATARIHRFDWPDDKYRDFTFTWDDAVRAGLDGRKAWKQYPKALLAQRAQANLCNLYAQDALMGLGYTHDELGKPVDESGALLWQAAPPPDVTLVVPPQPSAADPSEVEQPGGEPDGGSPTTPAPPAAAPVANEPIQPAEQSEIAEPPEPGSFDAPEDEAPADPLTRISQLLAAGRYTQDDWNRYLARYNLKSIQGAESFFIDETIDLLKELYQCQHICRLADISREEWELMLRKRDVQHDLELTVEQARELHEKLAAKFLPF